MKPEKLIINPKDDLMPRFSERVRGFVFYEENIQKEGEHEWK